jgi:aldehyde:ferredoxin oxidoreductase
MVLSKIVYVNLSTETVEEKEYGDDLIQYYGRGLTSYLVKENVPPYVGRYFWLKRLKSSGSHDKI